MIPMLRNTRVRILSLLLLGLGWSVPVRAAAPAAEIEPPQMQTFVKAEYPKDLLDKGLRGQVVLELDLDVEGKVSKATVAESAGPDFDAAALEAGKQLQFSPARAAGKAIPVRIKFRYVFTPEEHLERRPVAPSLGRYDRRGPETAPPGFSSLSGTVTERGTGRPVPGALITLPALGAEAVTDGDGSFRFGSLKAGSHALYLPGADHKPLRTTVTIADGKTTTLRLRAERLSYTIYRASAEAPPEPGEVSRRSLGVEEIQRIPGVYGDAFKVVQNLPGVSRATAGSGQIVVRGSAPADTIVSIEGVRVPLLYHFGGVYSVLNTDLLDAIDFYPGGYPVRYGRQTGGLIQARLAAPKKDAALGGYIESNVFHTGALLRIPLGENTQLTVAGRRSYIDAILAIPAVAKQIPFSFAPRYYDYQAKLDHRFGERTDATLLLFGSDDSLKAVLPDPPAAFPDAHGSLESSTHFAGGLAVVRHRGDGWQSSTTLGAVVTGLDASFGSLFRLSISSREYTLRQDFTIGDGPVQLRTGLDLLCNPFAVEIYSPALRSTGEQGQSQQSTTDMNRMGVKQSGFFLSPAVYFDTVLRLHPKLDVVPGVRLDLYRGDSGGETFTPRLNVRYRLTADWTLKAATGMGSQRAQPQELGRSFGNPSLLPFHSYESAAGLEWKVSEAIDLDVQGFRKDLWDVVVVGPGIVPTPPFVNSGTGRIIGLEVLLRHKAIGPFFGWLSYTLQHATRIDHPGDTERLFGWDQTHIMTALGSYKLPANWEVGARFRLVTGNPMTSIVNSAWNDKSDTYQPVQSACVNCARLPTFHQLDVRVDKKWIYDAWMLNVYLDVQNVYNHANPEAIQYNFDATQHTYATGLPIIPSFGIRGEF